MAKLTLPKADVPVATCPHCGRNVLMTKTWLQKLTEIVKAINTLNEA